MIRPHELDAGARVEGAGHAHGDFAGGLFDDLGLKAAPVKNEIGNARPLVVAHPAFRGGPDFVAAVIRPARLQIVLTFGQDFPRQVLIDEEKFLVAELKLNRAAADLRRDE